MRALLISLLILAVLVTQYDVARAEVRDRKRKTRGYRVGYLDPKEMYEKN